MFKRVREMLRSGRERPEERRRAGRAKRPPQPSAPKRSLDETLGYWREPDADNDPRGYLEKESAQQRSRFLVEWISAAVPAEARLFELGCNAGRNLWHLYRAGFCNLTAVEINEGAVALLRERLPDVAAATNLLVGPAESLLPDLPDAGYDLVFTMAVLEHVHTESEWLFEELARITGRWLLTIEDERNDSWRHFPRNYRGVFEGLGLRQTRHEQLELERHGLPRNFHARLFERAT